MTPNDFLWALLEGTSITIGVRSIIDMYYFRKVKKILRNIDEKNLTECKVCLLIKTLQKANKTEYIVFIPWKDLPNKKLLVKIKEILAKTNDDSKLLCDC